MLGLGDFSVTLCFYLVILSTLLCIVYGALNWNKGETSAALSEAEKKWDKEEHELEEEL